MFLWVFLNHDYLSLKKRVKPPCASCSSVAGGWGWGEFGDLAWNLRQVLAVLFWVLVSSSKNYQASSLRSLPTPKCLPSSLFLDSLSPPSLPQLPPPPAVSPGSEQTEKRNKETRGQEVTHMLIEAEVGEWLHYCSQEASSLNLRARQPCPPGWSRATLPASPLAHPQES